jgi:hypothetical protein
MRGRDVDTSGLFSYLWPESRVRHDHPLRKIRALTDAAFAELSPQFDRLYSRIPQESKRACRTIIARRLPTGRSRPYHRPGTPRAPHPSATLSIRS